jgi:hypothetical protein
MLMMIPLRLSIFVGISLITAKRHAPKKMSDAYKHEPQFGAAVLEYVNFDTSPLVIGTGESEFSPLPGAQNCRFLGGNLATSSDFPCKLQGNAVYKVTCDRELHLQATLRFQASLLNGTVTSNLGIADDPAYGYAYVGFTDDQAGWLYQFFLTTRKIYAAYARLPTPSRSKANNYVAFFYLVPLANREAADQACLQLIVNPGCPFLSWSVDGVEALRVHPAGATIDGRFDIASFGGCDMQLGTAKTVRLALGTSILQADQNTGLGNFPVCQAAIYQECFDDINSACRTACQPKQGPFNQADPVMMSLIAGFGPLSVTEYKRIVTCACDVCGPETEPCKEEPGECCEGDECAGERRARGPEQYARRSGRRGSPEPTPSIYQVPLQSPSTFVSSTSSTITSTSTSSTITSTSSSTVAKTRPTGHRAIKQ